MAVSIRVAVDESSQVAEARRVARKCALDLGFDEGQAERVAIVVTEVGTNILKFAGRGEILINKIFTGDRDLDPGLEILALDRGPGITNIERCLRDGYSTAGSAGQGLGAISRLSTFSDIYSLQGKGTALLARWMREEVRNGSPVNRLKTGAVNACKPGQIVCGDDWSSIQGTSHTTFLVADGLGHGLEASIASQEATRVLREQPELEPKAVLELVHSTLRSTRGAAVAVARIDPVRKKLTFSGAGNIAAQIYSGAQACQHLVSVNGTAGHQLQQAREFSYPWPENGILILHSDGLATGTSLDSHPGATMRDPSLIAGLLYRDYSRGHDDATVVVVKQVRTEKE